MASLKFESLHLVMFFHFLTATLVGFSGVFFPWTWAYAFVHNLQETQILIQLWCTLIFCQAFILVFAFQSRNHSLQKQLGFAYSGMFSVTSIVLFTNLDPSFVNVPFMMLNAVSLGLMGIGYAFGAYMHPIDFKRRD